MRSEEREMAVRIVEEKPDPSVIKQVVCRNCGVKLEYVPADVQDGVDTDYTGSKDPFKFIECPKCKKEVRV
jgi:uncharacterized protein with PIN domain